MGVVSFFLALISGSLFVLLILLIPLFEDVVAPEMDAPGLGLLVIMLAFLTALSQIAALGLGIAGAFQRQHKKLFAFAGIAISVAVLVFAYVQDVILPVWM